MRQVVWVFWPNTQEKDVNLNVQSRKPFRFVNAYHGTTQTILLMYQYVICLGHIVLTKSCQMKNFINNVKTIAWKIVKTQLQQSGILFYHWTLTKFAKRGNWSINTLIKHLESILLLKTTRLVWWHFLEIQWYAD